MVSRGGRCLCSVLILTGFLFGATNGETTMGPTTTLNIDDCASMPCMNGGTCTDGTNFYTCDCTGTGFEGTNCEIDIDDCDPDPCKNGGTCTDGTNRYMCDCTGTGYEGTNCTIDIDDCLNSPCANGGTCKDLVNDYNCTCPAGFEGKYCQNDTRECDAMPCKNNGTCVDGTDYYECYCLKGFNGANCEIEVAELANPGYSDVLSKQLQLVWDFTVQGNDEGINCTAKNRIRGTNNTEDTNVGSTSPGVVMDLEPYTTYEFQLLCVNLAGSSDPLDFAPQPTLAGKPSPPRNVRTSDVQPRRVSVEWDEPVVKNGPIDGYVLIAKGGIEDLYHATLGSGTSTILDELTPYTTYRISIHAFNINIPEGRQFSVESSPSDTLKTSEAAPGKPAVLTINDTPTECIISWRQPSEPNGVITRYTLYTEVLRMDTYAVDKTFRWEVPGSQMQKTFMKAELAPFSIFRYSVTASTAPGEGVNATTTDTCETPQGVPVEPDTIPSPSDNAISQTSFMTTLPPHDARNGPISCCEVIVVELQSGDADLDSSDSSYGPAQIKSYKEAQNTIGTPYSAVVFSNCPTDEVKVVIGATTDNSSTCYTGGSAGSASRRRRQTTSASTLTAVNGLLNTGGIYSTFVRVYTPSPEDPQMAFYESGPFMVPVTLKSSDTPVTLTIVSVIVILVLICVIMIFICIRKRKRSRQQGNRSSPIASASFTTTPRMCTDLLSANSPTSSGNRQVDDVYHEYERVCGQDSSKSSTRANQGTSQGISLTKRKSTSENDQSHDYENPSFDDKEYTDLDFSQVKKGGDPTKPTSSGKEYTDLDFSKIEKGGVPTKSFDGKEDVDPAYEVCII